MNEHRRSVLRAAALAAGGWGLGSGAAWAIPGEPPPETNRLRIVRFRSVCQAPMFVAEQILRREGFTDISHVEGTGVNAVDMARALADGRADFVVHFVAPLAMAIDRGAEISVLGGVHPGCFELFTTTSIRSVKDLKGKTVCIPGQESVQHGFLASIVASVGLDPQKDLTWAIHPPDKGKALLAEGRVDGYLGFPPDPQELRDKKIGHMLLSSSVDRPWSQYFCCMAACGREWLARHPIAAKRVMRALMKGAEMCAADPDLGVKAYLAAGFPANPEYARQAVKEMPYRRWRDFNPEATLRFYALRLREAGMVKGTPQKILAQGTDWRILEELKREMKS